MAFLIIIMIPIVLLAVSGSAIINYQMNSIQQSYDVEARTLETIINPMHILNKVTRGVYNDIKTSALKTPERLEDMDYIEELNYKLEGRYSFIVLRKNDEILFLGDNVRLNKIKESLPVFGVYRGNIDGAIYIGGKNPYMVKQQDFYYEDNSEGSIFIITDVNTFIPEVRVTVIQITVSFIVILCLTAIILTFWIYRSILRPLNTLRTAAKELKDGNLNYSIQSTEDDEIGALCDDFEKMRIKLKELIETKMQYEVDTKELISNISHDLKTPLTAIQGYAEGIMDGVADTPEKQKKYLKTIYTKTNDMTTLVDELSLFSKIDCDSMLYNFMNVNLNHYFNDCINEITLDLEVKNIDVAFFNYTESEPKVIADAEQLKRVINNIIGNSSKYIGKKKGIINIRIKDSSDFVQVEIEDNGKGIAKKDLPYIFDRFYRTDASRNSSMGGSGLGLSIAKKIIEDHGGRVWITSKEEVGTSIFFTLKKSEEGMLADAPTDKLCKENSDHIKRFGINKKNSRLEG